MPLGDLVVRIVGDNAEFDKAVDKSRKKFDDFVKLGEGLQRVGKNLSLYVTAPLLAAFGLATKAAGEQAAAEAQLANAIKTAGNEATISIKALSGLASELQRTTLYGDDASLAALTLLEQLAALDQEGLVQLLPRIQNFATAMDVDLATAAELVGKTLGSTTNALSRYGVQLKEGLDPTQKLAALTEQLDAKFAGAAETAGAAGTGPLTILKNVASDMAETFGNALLPTISKIVDVLKGIFTWIGSLDEGTVTFIVTVAALVAAIGPIAGIIGGIITAVSTLMSVFTGVNGVMSLVAGGPITLIIAAVAALAFGVYELIKNWDAVSAFFKDLWDKILVIFNAAKDAIVNFAKNLYEGVREWLIGKFEAVVNGIKEAIDKVVGFFRGLYDSVVGKSIVPDLVNGVIAEFQRMADETERLSDLITNTLKMGFVTAFSAVGDALVSGEDAWMAFKDAARDALATILDGLAKYLVAWGAAQMLTGNIIGGGLAIAGAAGVEIAAGVIRAMGGGGVIAEPVLGTGLATGTRYLMGESGPEMVTPLSQYIPSPVLGGGGGEGDIHLVVKIDSRPILEKIFPATRNRTVLIYGGAVV